MDCVEKDGEEDSKESFPTWPRSYWEVSVSELGFLSWKAKFG